MCIFYSWKTFILIIYTFNGYAKNANSIYGRMYYEKIVYMFLVKGLFGDDRNLRFFASVLAGAFLILKGTVEYELRCIKNNKLFREK